MRITPALALPIVLGQQRVRGVDTTIVDGAGERGRGPRDVTADVMVAVALGAPLAVAGVTQPLTDWPYEQYRQRHGVLRGKGTPPGPGPKAGPGTRSVTAG